MIRPGREKSASAISVEIRKSDICFVPNGNISRSVEIGWIDFVLWFMIFHGTQFMLSLRFEAEQSLR